MLICVSYFPAKFFVARVGSKLVNRDMALKIVGMISFSRLLRDGLFFSYDYEILAIKPRLRLGIIVA